MLNLQYVLHRFIPKESQRICKSNDYFAYLQIFSFISAFFLLFCHFIHFSFGMSGAMISVKVTISAKNRQIVCETFGGMDFFC